MMGGLPWKGECNWAVEEGTVIRLWELLVGCKEVVGCCEGEWSVV